LLTSKLLAYREILRCAAVAEDGTGGHPARVGLDAIGLSSEEMQTIAAQVGNSETAFITERRDAGRIIVRYFRADAWKTINAGEVVSIPRNARHALRNTSSSPTTSMTVSEQQLYSFFRELARPFDPHSLPAPPTPNEM
jgi:hypothetical protein